MTSPVKLKKRPVNQVNGHQSSGTSDSDSDSESESDHENKSKKKGNTAEKINIYQVREKKLQSVILSCWFISS